MLTVPAAAVLSLFLVGMILWLINGFIPIPAGRIKTLLNVVLGLIVVGIGLWLINAYVPMAGVIKGILNIVVVIATCVGVLQAFGLWEPVVNMARKIRNHRWTHPEQDQQPAIEKAATEEAATERAAREKASSDKPASERAESPHDSAVTVIVK
jgi:hypothetical protein